MTRVLVTGATGFIGRALVFALHQRESVTAVAAIRSKSTLLPDGVAQIDDLDLDDAAGWADALEGVGCVVHLAGVVPTSVQAGEDDSIFQRVNVDGTLALASAAASAGVRRFVALSSIGVNGLENDRGHPFSIEDPPAPHNSYAVSKRVAEDGLHRIAAQTGMEVTIIRPPLVYGAQASGSFGLMLKIVDRRLPLPLGATRNKRSYVALDNLVDLISTCLDHPAAANRTFLVSDGEDLSTTDLLRRLGHALGKPARLLPVPVWMLTMAAMLLKKKRVAQRLCGNLQVDIAHTCDTLDWQPPVSVDEALKQTAAAYRAERAGNSAAASGKKG